MGPPFSSKKLFPHSRVINSVVTQKLLFVFIQKLEHDQLFFSDALAGFSGVLAGAGFRYLSHQVIQRS